MHPVGSLIKLKEPKPNSVIRNRAEWLLMFRGAQDQYALMSTLHFLGKTFTVLNVYSTFLSHPKFYPRLTIQLLMHPGGWHPAHSHSQIYWIDRITQPQFTKWFEEIST